MSTPGTPGPGWYQDPGSPWLYRFWDGSAWTEHTAPTGAHAAGPMGPMGPAGPGGPAGGKFVPPLPFPAVRADFGRRALGYVVDGLVIGVPLIIVFVLVIVAIFASVSTTDGTTDPSPVFLLILPVEAGAFLLPLLYNGFFTGGGRRTVGQRVAGLRVVDARTGEPLTLGKSFLRALVAGIGSGQVMGLGYWWALWDAEGRTWHDMAVTSVVVDVRDVAPVPGMLTAR